MVGADSIALNPVIIQGRNQAVRYRRLADSKKNPEAQVVTRKNKPNSRFTSPSLFLIRNG